LIGRNRIQVAVDVEEVIRRRLPDQGAVRRTGAAYPEHPQVEERPRPVERREVEREGRYAQSLERAWTGIENVRRNVPVGAGEVKSLHLRGGKGDHR